MFSLISYICLFLKADWKKTPELMHFVILEMKNQGKEDPFSMPLPASFTWISFTLELEVSSLKYFYILPSLLLYFQSTHNLYSAVSVSHSEINITWIHTVPIRHTPHGMPWILINRISWAIWWYILSNSREPTVFKQ